MKTAYQHARDTAGIYVREWLLCCYFCQGLKTTSWTWLLGFDFYGFLMISWSFKWGNVTRGLNCMPRYWRLESARLTHRCGWKAVVISDDGSLVWISNLLGGGARLQASENCLLLCLFALTFAPCQAGLIQIGHITASEALICLHPSLTPASIHWHLMPYIN